jgi:N-acetylmuramoyl-L-alanine amidase
LGRSAQVALVWTTRDLILNPQPNNARGITTLKFYLLFLSWLSVLLFALPAQAARLLFWRFDPSQNQLLFTTDVGVQPTAQLIANPTRLVIDLPGIVLGRPTVNQSLSGVVRSVRVGQFDDRTTRIVVELAPGYTLDPEQIKFRGTSPTNWSVELPNPEAIALPRLQAEPAPPTTTPSREERENTVSANKLATIEAIETRNSQLVIRADQPMTASSRWDDRAGLYEITIPNARLAERVQGPQLESDSPIAELRVRQQDSQTVILLLQPTDGFRLDSINPRGRRLNIDLEQGTSLVPAPGPEKTNAQQVAVPLPTNEPAPTATELPTVPDGRIRAIVDPGHGGEDFGALGLGGLQEKEVVLDVSQQVAQLLEKQGVQVSLTRSDDRFISLQGRTDMANRIHADLFVSIHANSVDERPEVSGLETYYFANGLKLASTIHQNILETVNIRDRAVRQARFYVLRNSAMPAVLVEIGFVTGSEDAANLKNPEHRHQLAVAIARGILQYIQQNLL